MSRPNVGYTDGFADRTFLGVTWATQAGPTDHDRLRGRDPDHYICGYSYFTETPVTTRILSPLVAQAPLTALFPARVPEHLCHPLLCRNSLHERSFIRQDGGDSDNPIYIFETRLRIATSHVIFQCYVNIMSHLFRSSVDKNEVRVGTTKDLL